MKEMDSHLLQDLPSFDVAVVGGSYAGMSAALQLARACRTVLEESALTGVTGKANLNLANGSVRNVEPCSFIPKPVWR